MMKKFVMIMMSLLIAVSLLGCQQEEQNDAGRKIQSVPNKAYIGNPHPSVKEEIKLTDEEKQEFQQLQKDAAAKEGQ